MNRGDTVEGDDVLRGGLYFRFFILVFVLLFSFRKGQAAVGLFVVLSNSLP